MNNPQLEQESRIKSWLTREKNEYKTKANLYRKEAQSNLTELKQLECRVREKESALRVLQDQALALVLIEEKHKALQLNTRVRLMILQYEQMKRMRDMTLQWFCQHLCPPLTKMTLEEKQKIEKQEELEIYIKAKRELQEYKARYGRALLLRNRPKIKASEVTARGDYDHHHKTLPTSHIILRTPKPTPNARPSGYDTSFPEAEDTSSSVLDDDDNDANDTLTLGSEEQSQESFLIRNTESNTLVEHISQNSSSHFITDTPAEVQSILEPQMHYLQVPQESKQLKSVYPRNALSDEINEQQTRASSPAPSRPDNSTISDYEMLENSLCDLVLIIIEEQRKKAQDEMDRLAAGDDESVIMRSNNSVNRIASTMVNLMLCKQFRELESARRLACGENDGRDELENLFYKFPQPVDSYQIISPPLNVEELSQIAVVGLGAMSSGGSGPPIFGGGVAGGRPLNNFEATSSASGTIELLSRRDVSDSAMDFVVQPSEFVKEHVVAVESDMSTVGGFHLHPELGESHIHVLGSTSVSPSFANFENKFGIATDTSGPSRNSQQQGSTQPPPIAVQQQGTSRPGHNSPARGASYPPVFSSAPQDVRKSVLEQLSSIRDEVDALRREIIDAGRGNNSRRSGSQQPQNSSEQRSQQQQPRSS
ncbi:uncharacterized protein LOC110843894 isoform X2 [Folsomia candida]|uniref:uncharacterized protein LOC110843894 isoform X2 n=1 Tax=Folsomia candida TaxID=158441 RepID=UPI0016050A15|nr:uncharacterized protein LOC110843894 isoform X2 [Folsomia candida]